MIGSHSSIPCILKGGPKNGEEHDLACLDDKGTVPCNLKQWFHTVECPTCHAGEDCFITYRIKWTDSPEFERDDQGRAVLYFDGYLGRNGKHSRNVDENGKWKVRP